MTTVVSAILQADFDRWVPYAGNVMEFLRQLNVDIIAELSKLKNNFRIVSGVLHDAEQKQIRNPAVEDWLGELRHLAYDTEDLLDNLATDAKAWKLEKESETRLSQVHPIISPILKFWSKREQVDKIKSLAMRFDQITNQSHDLGLIHGVRESAMGVEQRPLTTSIVNESFIYGRDNDVEWILQQLLSTSANESDHNKISVIPIVGMGGVGKTTLAQLVYNHERLKDRFNLKLWVCVSDEFDLTRITKAILESITAESDDQKELQSLQTKLQHGLRDKKFLLVLDDIWTEKPSDWDRLRAPFEAAANGSCVVLTTRSEKVSAIMRTVDNYNLRKLSDADCQRLFYQQAFVEGNADAHPKLKEIGGKIVKKCKGLPLAAKTLGALLRCNLDITEWEHVLNDDIWDLPESGIIPSLRLSYYYLPSHLKRCFAYCAIFPQDYEFNKEELVLLWMAEGFLLPQRNKRMEDVGDQYFGELLSRSFFQRSGNNKSKFEMHDLILDLAKSISNGICLDPGDGINVDASWKNDKSLVRHILVSAIEKFKVMSSFGKARSLRSLIFQSDDFYDSKRFLYDVVPELTYLRVLSFERCQNIKELPESIGKLKGLRYLNLSKTEIERLPESVSTLYNLQTLKLSGCKSLVQLPNDMSNLIDLRHLLIDECFYLKKMPLGIGKLTNLQSLPIFVAGKRDEPNIKELRNIQQLRGVLSITRLENVVDAWEAKQAKLGSKEHIRTLILNWSDHCTSREVNSSDEDVIQALQPHTNITNLIIECYHGKRLPNWLGCSSYSMLETLKLLGCGNCECLPPLGCLWSLKHLVVGGLDGVRKVGPEFYGDVSVVESFVSLESLIFNGMKGLEEWSGFEKELKKEFPRLRHLEIHNSPNLREFSCRFPQLEELKISCCAKLISLPRCLPMLKKLEIQDCNEKIMTSVVQFPLLTCLCISSISNLKHLPLGMLRKTFLETLKIVSCGSLKSFGRITFVSNVKHIDVSYCKNLESLPYGMINLMSLQSLTIKGCDRLTSFPDGGLPRSLQSLSIKGCNHLASLPDQGLPTATLTELEISDCKSLNPFPKNGFPRSLTSLTIENCKAQKPMSEWGLHKLTSLASLSIGGFSGLASIPVCLLPPNLTHLCITKLPDLQFLPDGLVSLTSLEILEIEKCDKLLPFLETGLPSSISELHVSGCPTLQEWCEKETEKNGSNIVNISIEIGKAKYKIFR